MADVHTPRSLIPPKLKLTIVQEDQLDSDGEHGSERIPFTESTNLKLSDLDRQNRILRNKSKENSPKRVASPRSRIRLQNNEMIEHSTMESTSAISQRPTTPTPESEDQQAPLTPTANLKMLFSAMSPELRNREKKKELFLDDDTRSEGMSKNEKLDPLNDNEAEISSSQEDWKPGSRKEKSLGLLCQKFLQKYPEYPSANESHEISLDEVAKELAVERRRIYDIVNVLESVEIVSRIAKNKYAWHGKTNLVNTLGKLKALGEAEGFAEQLRKVKDYELNRELEEQNSCSSTTSSTKCDSSTSTEDLTGAALLRKDKSLGIMSQKFLMLFLVSEPRTVNLDLAAKILIGDPNIDRTENAKFKTKIRRLYDIANILTSLDLIRKVHVTEIRGRKPAFKYIGPEVDNMNDISVCYNDGYHRPSSRHSLLDCVKNHQVAEMMCPYKPIKPNVPGKCPEEPEKVHGSKGNIPPTKKSFTRTSSFDQICEIAEKEMTRLYGSMSQPSSPTAEFANKGFRKCLSQEEISKPTKNPVQEKGKAIILQQKGGQFHIVQSENSSQVTESLPGFVKKLEVQSVPKETSVPNENTSSRPESTKTTDTKKAETIVVKTAQINKKQATMIPLTKDQIDAVLKSLKVPVPISKNLKKPGVFKEVVEVTDNLKPKTQVVETKTVVCSLVKSDENAQKRVCPSEEDSAAKKFKIDFPSPPSDSDTPSSTQSAKLSKERLSPQRALHLTPEFGDTPPLTKIAKLNQSLSGLITSESDLDLAAPLPDSEDSSDSTSHFLPKAAQPKQNVQRITVQLPNQSPTIVQFPVVSNSSDSISKASGQPLVSSLTQPMQIIQGVPLTATGMHGQPINFMVPVTFSPPLTPQSDQSSPTMFSFPSSSPQCNVSVIQSTTSLKTLTPDIAVTSISGKSTLPQLVTPTERPIAPPTKFFGHTPGGIVSPSNSLPSATKEMYSTARKLDLKLDLPDVSA